MKSLRSTYCILLAMQAAFILSFACTAQSQSQPGWEEHSDPLGFSISHPEGWSVETPGKELIRVVSPDGTSFVTIYPFILGREVSSKEYLEAVPDAFSSISSEGHP